MKILPFYIAVTAVLLSPTHSVNADVDLTFDAAAGQTLSATDSASGSWSGTQLTLGNGTLNVGYTSENKSFIVNDNNTISTYTLTDALTEGEHTFEIIISDHDYSKSMVDYIGTVVFNTMFSVKDSNNNAAIIGLTNGFDLREDNFYLGTSLPKIYSEDSGYDSIITDVTIDEFGRYENGNYVSGSDENPLLVNGVAQIILQITVNLNSDTWTARAKFGSSGWTLLTADGTGLDDISSINIITSYDNSSVGSTYNWGNDSTDGTSSNFVTIDSLSLSEVVPEPLAVGGPDMLIRSSKFGGSTDENFTATAVGGDSPIGNSDQASTEPVKLEIGVNLANGKWYSRASFSEGGVYGTPVELVTDGKGMNEINSFSIVTVQPEDLSDSWGISSDGGDSVKIDSIRLLQGDPGSSGIDFNSNLDSPYILAEFNEADSGINIAKPSDNENTPEDESDVTTVEITGSSISTSNSFNIYGHYTDGNGNLTIGFEPNSSSTINFDSASGKTFRKYTLDSALTGQDFVVFEVILSDYDLSASWDTDRSSGSLSGKGIQFLLQQTDTTKAASIELSTYNSLSTDSVLHLDFDDAKGTELKETAVIGNVTGSWDHGGPQTNGNGTLGIGYTNAWIWAIKDNEGNISANSRRSFNLSEPLPLGRYIIETVIDSALLSGAWEGENAPVISNKGLEIAIKQSDGSGVKLALLSHKQSDGDYAPKVSSAILSGPASTDAAQVYSPTGKEVTGTNAEGDFTTITKTEYRIPSDATLNMQILVDTRSGKWSSRVKNSKINGDSVIVTAANLHENDIILDTIDDGNGNISYEVSVWRPLETEGEGLTDISSIQLNAVTPFKSDGFSLAAWGDETLESAGDEGTRVPGDYIKLDQIRILKDSSEDIEFGMNASAIKEKGSNLELQLDVNLDTGEWTSYYTPDGGVKTLLETGTGVDDIDNIYFTPRRHADDLWGNSIAGGFIGDFVTINSIDLMLTDSNGVASTLVDIDFNESTGTQINQTSSSGSLSDADGWNYGGIQVQNGNLNIGYTKYYKWSNKTSDGSVQERMNQGYRRFGLGESLSQGNVTLIVNIDEYDFSRSWDEQISLPGKGIEFGLSNGYAVDENSTKIATAGILTKSQYADTDGDNILDVIDEYPRDKFNGAGPSGMIMSHDFEEADTGINATNDSGDKSDFYFVKGNGDVVIDPFNYGSVKTDNLGNLVYGFGPTTQLSDVNTSAVFRSKSYEEAITSGVYVYEAVISAYDLSRSWDQDNASFDGKGWRFNALNSSNIGAAMNLLTSSYIDENDETIREIVVTGQSWNGERIVLGEHGSVSLGQADQKNLVGDDDYNGDLVMQIIINTDTGAWYSRVKQGSANWQYVTTNGSGMTEIKKFQIGVVDENAPGSSGYNSSKDDTPAWRWGEGNNVGDHVLIDSLQLRELNIARDRSIEESSIDEPVLPTDTDEDGYYDYEDAFVNDAAEWLDEDGDGVGSNNDPDDSDPEKPNPTTPPVAPSLTISADGNGNIQINWTSSAGFSLQSSSDLATYSAASGTIQDADGISTYTESIESGNKFFKLSNE